MPDNNSGAFNAVVDAARQLAKDSYQEGFRDGDAHRYAVSVDKVVDLVHGCNKAEARVAELEAKGTP